MTLVIVLAIFLLATISLTTGVLLVLRSMYRYRGAVQHAMNSNLEIIRVRQSKHDRDGSSAQPEAWKEEIGGMEQLLTTLANMRTGATGLKQLLYGKPTITFEIANPSGHEEIFFYIAVPKKFHSALEKQVHSYYPDAEVEKIEDYTIFAPGSSAAMAHVKLAKSYALPVRTYEMMEADPLNEITTALSKLDTASEGACVQIVAQPTSKAWRSKGRKIAHEMQQGKQLKDVVSSGVMMAILGMFRDVIFSPKKDNAHAPRHDAVQLTPEEQEVVKAIERKTSKAALRVNVRLLASADNDGRAQEILAYLENAFAQFEYPEVNHFSVRRHTHHKKQIAFDYIFRSFREDTAMVLGVEECASMFHFPISTTETPKITWLKAGSSPPPPNIPEEGLLLGHNDYRGAQTPIRLSDSDRRRHLYVIGQTGVGKSSFLQELAKQDVTGKRGMCFIDPHGDAIEDIFTAIPRDRAEDVIYFDPADTERPFGLNMMEFTRPEEKTFVVNEMINIFDKLYDLRQTGGPMFEQYMRNAMLLVMEDTETGSTLMEIPKVLADEKFRRMKLERCKNTVVKEFWVNEAEKAGGEAALANIVPYVTSKLTPFLTNDMMRPIISQQQSTINFRDVMDEQKILLINLSKGKIGELNSYLLGMIIIGKILMSALSRVDIAEDERKDFYLYIDEFQNVTTDSIGQILSEARKYRLSLTIAHQFIGQLSEDISKAVFGNVGSMAAFRVGPEDAEFLEQQFAPIFSANDLVNVDNYQCFMRTLMNNRATAPFNMKTYPPTEGSAEIVAQVKELSRLKYGRDKQLVEQEVAERSRVTQAAAGAPVRADGEHSWG